jgi:hypothetical protein
MVLIDKNTLYCIKMQPASMERSRDVTVFAKPDIWNPCLHLYFTTSPRNLEQARKGML